MLYSVSEKLHKRMKKQREHFGNHCKIVLFKINFDLLTKSGLTPCRKTRYKHRCKFPLVDNQEIVFRFFRCIL